MSWKEQEERKKREAEERARQEAEKKNAVLAELKAEREGGGVGGGAAELHGAKNQGETARYGGGGETSWNKQDKMLNALDALDGQFDEVLK